MDNTDAPRTPILRPILWVLLTLGVLGNAAASLLTDGVLVHSGFGLVALAAGAGLVAGYLRSQRAS